MPQNGVLYSGRRQLYEITEPGTSGQVLTSNGADAPPSFQDPTGGGGGGSPEPSVLTGYFSPLVAVVGGSPIERELVFGPDGDVVMVFIPF